MLTVLRDFLYLDADAVSRSLAQLEGGIYDEEEQQRTEGRSGSGEAQAKLGPVSGRRSRGQDAEEQTRRTMHQTPESDFRRLERLLVEQDGVQELSAFDEAIWQQLQRGEVLAVEANLSVPELFRWTEMASSVGPLVGLMRAFGEEIDADTETAVSGLTQLGEAAAEVPGVARPLGAPKFKFVCPLRRDALKRDVGELAGECIVVGMLRRRFKPGERYSMLDAFGMGGLPRAERRKMEREMRGKMADAVISAPAALLSPLAVYR